MPRDPLSIATILGFTGMLLLVLVYSIINNVVIFPFFLVATTLGTVFFMYFPRISIMFAARRAAGDGPLPLGSLSHRPL